MVRVCLCRGDPCPGEGPWSPGRRKPTQGRWHEAIPYATPTPAPPRLRHASSPFAKKAGGGMGIRPISFPDRDLRSKRALGGDAGAINFFRRGDLYHSLRSQNHDHGLPKFLFSQRSGWTRGPAVRRGLVSLRQPRYLPTLRLDIPLQGNRSPAVRRGYFAAAAPYIIWSYRGAKNLPFQQVEAGHRPYNNYFVRRGLVSLHPGLQ